MRDKHIFSKSYTERKEAVLHALRREEALKSEKRLCHFTNAPVKILASAAIVSVLTVSVYAVVHWIDFRMEQNGDEVRIHASLNETGENTGNNEKPLRSWRAEDGEISVKVNIPDLPADMSEDLTASGKYGSENNSRSMTINGIDLRRSELDHIIGGATEVKQLDVGGKTMYIVEKGEANFYNRIAYIVFEEDELVLKLWVSCAITDTELTALASTMTLEYTSDALLAIPIQNELGGTTSSDTSIIYIENEPVYEADLIEIGQSAHDYYDMYTVTVNNVNVSDNISTLDPDGILRENFVGQFTDDDGNLIPYNRTEVIWNLDEEGYPISKQFGDTVSVKKKLFIVTLTMKEATMDEISESDREEILEACVNGFELHAYTVVNDEIKMQLSNAVVDRKPNANADSSEIVYREYLGNNQWRIAYLIDESDSEGNLVLNASTGKIYVNIR